MKNVLLKKSLIAFLTTAFVFCIFTKDSMADNLSNNTGTDDIIGILKSKNPEKNHPRIMATSEDFDRIKTNIAGGGQTSKWYANVKKEADKTLKENPVKYELPDGVRLLSISRKALTRIQNLGLVYRVSGDKKYAERAWLELETICDANTDQAQYSFDDWHPVHFLDTAEMTNAAAIGYDWLYDYLSDEQKEVIRKAILEKGLNQSLSLYRSQKGWTKEIHNWNSVCNGGMGIGALAIGDEGGEYEAAAREVLNGTLKSLPKMTSQYAPDGAWIEGPGYWNYGTTYLAYYLSALDTAMGTDFGLSEQTGLSETVNHPIYLTGPKGAFNFADSGEGIEKGAVMLWLAEKYNKPDFAWYHDFALKNSGGTAMDVIWYKEGLQGRKPAEQDKYFRHTEVVGIHSNITEAYDSFVGFKAGYNQANHGDLDIGTFVFDQGGIRWASDLGSDNYNLPGYFDKGVKGKRWLYYRKRAEGHNTLVINPSQKPDQNPLAKAVINKFASDENGSFAITDMTTAYDEYAISVKRGIGLINSKRDFIVQDEIKLKDKADLWWFMHTTASPQLTSDGRSAILSKDGRKMWAHIISPANAAFNVMDAVPLSVSPNPDGQKENKGITKLAIHIPDAKEVTLSVIMVPMEGDDIPVSNISLVPLDSWQTFNGEAKQITVDLNGTRLKLSKQPFISDNSTMVPLRDIFEALGATVEWNGADNSIKAVRQGKEVRLAIGKKTAFIGGKEVEIPVEPDLVGDKTFVPLRFVSEALGASVKWDEENMHISIDMKY